MQAYQSSQVEIVKVSKQYLSNINSSLRKITGFNQWQNTRFVLDWLNTTPNKQNCKFLKFDIVKYYPLISENFSP